MTLISSDELVDDQMIRRKMMQHGHQVKFTNRNTHKALNLLFRPRIPSLLIFALLTFVISSQVTFVHSITAGIPEILSSEEEIVDVLYIPDLPDYTGPMQRDVIFKLTKSKLLMTVPSITTQKAIEIQRFNSEESAKQISIFKSSSQTYFLLVLTNSALRSYAVDGNFWTNFYDNQQSELSVTVASVSDEEFTCFAINPSKGPIIIGTNYRYYYGGQIDLSNGKISSQLNRFDSNDKGNRLESMSNCIYNQKSGKWFMSALFDDVPVIAAFSEENKLIQTFKLNNPVKQMILLDDGSEYINFLGILEETDSVYKIISSSEGNIGRVLSYLDGQGVYPITMSKSTIQPTGLVDESLENTLAFQILWSNETIVQYIASQSNTVPHARMLTQVSSDINMIIPFTNTSNNINYQEAFEMNQAFLVLDKASLVSIRSSCPTMNQPALFVDGQPGCVTCQEGSEYKYGWNTKQCQPMPRLNSLSSINIQKLEYPQMEFFINSSSFVSIGTMKGGGLFSFRISVGENPGDSINRNRWDTFFQRLISMKQSLPDNYTDSLTSLESALDVSQVTFQLFRSADDGTQPTQLSTPFDCPDPKIAKIKSDEYFIQIECWLPKAFISVHLPQNRERTTLDYYGVTVKLKTSQKYEDAFSPLYKAEMMETSSQIEIKRPELTSISPTDLKPGDIITIEYNLPAGKDENQEPEIRIFIGLRLVDCPLIANIPNGAYETSLGGGKYEVKCQTSAEQSAGLVNQVYLFRNGFLGIFDDASISKITLNFKRPEVKYLSLVELNGGSYSELWKIDFPMDLNSKFPQLNFSNYLNLGIKIQADYLGLHESGRIGQSVQPKLIDIWFQPNSSALLQEFNIPSEGIVGDMLEWGQDYLVFKLPIGLFEWFHSLDDNQYLPDSFSAEFLYGVNMFLQVDNQLSAYSLSNGIVQSFVTLYPLVDLRLRDQVKVDTYGKLGYLDETSPPTFYLAAQNSNEESFILNGISGILQKEVFDFFPNAIKMKFRYINEIRNSENLATSTSNFEQECKFVKQLNLSSIECITPDFVSPGAVELILVLNQEHSLVMSSLPFEVEIGPFKVSSIKLTSKQRTIGFSTFGGESLELSVENAGMGTVAAQSNFQLDPHYRIYLVNQSDISQVLEFEGVQVSSNSLIRCSKTPQGVGSGWMIQVEIVNWKNFTVNSELVEFDYAEPAVTYVEPNQWEWKNPNQKINIYGMNIGYEGFVIDSMWLIDEDSPLGITTTISCDSLSEFTAPNGEKIGNASCILPGDFDASKLYNIQVKVGNQVSNITTRPQVHGLQPSNNLLTFSKSGNSQKLIVLGNNLNYYGGIFTSYAPNSAGHVIKVGNFQCQNIVVEHGSSVVSCDVPNGYGKDLNFEFSQNGFKAGFTGQATSIVSYIPPKVNSISPTVYTGQENLVWQITGEGFGGVESSNLVVKLYPFNQSLPKIFHIEGSWKNDTLIEATRPQNLSLTEFYVHVVVADQESQRNESVIFDNKNDKIPPETNALSDITNRGTNLICQLSAELRSESEISKFLITKAPLNGILYEFSESDSSLGPEILVGGEISATPGKLFYKPNKYYSGTDSFSFKAIDDIGMESNVSPFQINVTWSNIAPEFTQTSLEVFVGSGNENSMSEFKVPVEDVDEQELTVFATSPPKRGQWAIGEDVQTTVDLVEGVKIAPGKNLRLIYQHDDLGGGFPFDSMVLKAKDSNGEESTNELKVTISVRCSVGLVNNIWSKTGKACLPCPTGAECSAIGDQYPVNEFGYFKLSNATFIKCSPEEACPLGTATVGELNSCTEGYAGTRCGKCIDGYFRAGEKCFKCATTELNLSIVLPLTLFVIILVLGVMMLIRKFDLGFFSIMVTLLQTLSVFEQFKLHWPDSVIQMFRVFSIFNLNIDLASPECFMKNDNENSSYELKFYSTMILPLALLGVAMVAYLSTIIFFWSKKVLARRRQARLEKSFDPDTPMVQKTKNYNELIPGAMNIGREEEQLWSLPRREVIKPSLNALDKSETPTITTSMLGGCLFAMKILYLSLARRALELFNCTSDGAGNYYFEAEPSRKCYTEKWWTDLLPISILAIVFYVIGIPVVSLYLSRRRMQIIAEKQPFERTKKENFILQITYKKKREFRNQFDFWDVVVMMRKFMIVACQLFFASIPGFQAVILLFVLLIAYILHKNYMPYASNSLNFLESTSIISSTLVLMAGLLFFNGAFYNQKMDALGIFVIVLVSGSIAVVLWMLLKHFKAIYVENQQNKGEESLEAS